MANPTPGLPVRLLAPDAATFSDGSGRGDWVTINAGKERVDLFDFYPKKPFNLPFVGYRDPIWPLFKRWTYLAEQYQINFGPPTPGEVQIRVSGYEIDGILQSYPQ